MRKSLRRSLKRVVSESLRHHHDELARRQAIRQLLIERASPRGTAAIEIWGRDCDQAEATTLRSIPARVPDFVRLENEEYDNAEGPTRITILTQAEAREWSPYFRDHAAEAAGF